MKKIDFKKLGVLIILIVVGVLAIFGIAKVIQKISGPSKAVVTEVEDKVDNYFTKLSIGHSSIFNGLDLLYDKDKVTYDDLTKGSIIEIAIRYAENKEKEMNVPESVLTEFQNRTKKTATGYKGSVIQEAVKELFDKDFALANYEAEANYLFDYYYNDDFDVLLKSKSNSTDVVTENNIVVTHIIDTKKEKGNIVTTVAVAYVYTNGSSYSFAADKNGVKKVDGSKENLEFPTDKVDEFPQYKFISKKVDDRYVFDSIEKITKEESK